VENVTQFFFFFRLKYLGLRPCEKPNVSPALFDVHGFHLRKYLMGKFRVKLPDAFRAYGVGKFSEGIRTDVFFQDYPIHILPNLLATCTDWQHTFKESVQFLLSD